MSRNIRSTRGRSQTKHQANKHTTQGMWKPVREPYNKLFPVTRHKRADGPGYLRHEEIRWEDTYTANDLHATARRQATATAAILPRGDSMAFDLPRAAKPAACCRKVRTRGRLQRAPASRVQHCPRQAGHSLASHDPLDHLPPRPHSPADVSRIQGPGPSAGKRDRGGPETWARETPRSPKAIFFFYPFIQETQRVGWYLGTRARAPTALRRALWERQSGRPRCVLWSGPAVCLLSCRRTSCFPPRCDKWESRVRQKVGSHTGGFGAETAPVSSGARMQE